MKKHSKFIIFFIINFIFITNVYGATVNMYYTYYNCAKNERDNGTFRVAKNINGESTYLDTIEVDGKTAFCIDVGATLEGRDTTNNLGISLEEYLNSKLPNNSKEIAKKINEYSYFGNQLLNSEANGQNYYIAAQKLIWDTLYQAGYRRDYYSSNANFTVQNSPIDISQEISRIEKEISDYYQTPSFCKSSNKIEMEVNTTTTLTDDNNVLSDFQLQCSDDLKCTKQNNKLNITMLNDTGNKNVSLVKSGEGTALTIYQKDNNSQAVIVNSGVLDPVTCTININGYVNPKTSDTHYIITLVLGLTFAIISYYIYYKKYLM